MKTTVFISKEITFEFENVVAVLKVNLCLEIWLFGGFKYLISDAEEISNFSIWYDIYLQNKISTEEILVEVPEEIQGL
jgi:hypothetical protein